MLWIALGLLVGIAYDRYTTRHHRKAWPRKPWTWADNWEWLKREYKKSKEQDH